MATHPDDWRAKRRLAGKKTIGGQNRWEPAQKDPNGQSPVSTISRDESTLLLHETYFQFGL